MAVLTENYGGKWYVGGKGGGKGEKEGGKGEKGRGKGRKKRRRKLERKVVYRWREEEERRKRGGRRGKRRREEKEGRGRTKRVVYRASFLGLHHLSPTSCTCRL